MGSTRGEQIPQVGWVVDGQQYTLEEALRIANTEGHFHFFPPAAIAALRQTREDGGNHLSPSGANKCHRQSILKAENDYYLDPEKQWAAFVGTAVHNQMETEDEHTEMFLSMDLEVEVEYFPKPIYKIADLIDNEPETAIVTVTLQGTTDHYDPERRAITDYKTVSEYRKYDPRLKRGADRTAADDDHILQVNLYRMLLEANGFPVESASVWYIQTYKEAKRNLFDVDLWDIEDTYELACQYAKPLAVWKLTGQLPPPLEEEDPRYWLCGRCPVAEICQTLAARGK